MKENINKLKEEILNKLTKIDELFTVKRNFDIILIKIENPEYFNTNKENK